MASKRKFAPHLLLYILLTICLIYIFTFIFVYKPLDKRFSSFNSLPVLAPDRISAGYTLISPYNRILTGEAKSKIILLDMLGRPIHTWTANHQALYSLLLKDARLLSVMELPKYSKSYPPGGNTGIIEIRDWDSQVLWDYKDEAMHHDIAELPNGNFAVALWRQMPADFAQQVKGGVEGTEMKANPQETNGIIWSDEVVEIDKNKKVVWSWNSWEHLDPSVDVLGDLIPRYAWSFINGLKYMEKNPIDGTPAYLASMRSLSTVMIIRKSDGEIIWRSPKGMLSLQHDPTLLANGNILVFDNGLDRVPAPFPIYGSRAVEINPKNNEVVWQFDSGKSPIDKVKFFAAIVGGAQRLSNGNTLITDGTRGHLFEVTKEGEVVWDMVSPYTTEQTGAFPNNFLFKSRRYAESDINWPQKISGAFNPFHFNLHRFLSTFYEF